MVHMIDIEVLVF